MRENQDRSEQLNEMLDPHRREEIASAATEISGRLLQKGIDVSADEDPALLGDLLSAVDRFEGAVINRGGDLMVNSPNSTDPQNPEYVIPTRNADEDLQAYIARINQAASRVEEPRRVS
jgi:hypothetical protein